MLSDVTLAAQVALWEHSLRFLCEDILPYSDSFSATAVAGGFATARRWDGALSVVSALLGRLQQRPF